MNAGQMKANSGGIFFGWWVVAAAMLCISTGVGPFAFASLGMFILPLSNEFGWSRAEISFSLTVLIGCSVVALPLIGRLVDRIGSRKIVFVSMLSFAGCLALVPFVSSLWQLTFVFFLMGTIAAGTNSVPYMPILSAWFVRRRGLAIGLAIAGIGLGYAYVPIILQYLIDNSGWRSGYFALSGIVLFIALPLAYFFLKETPAEMGLTPDGEPGKVSNAAKKSVGCTTSEILRHREFWILSAIFVILSFVLNGMLAHLVPMLSDRGMSTADAAAVAAVEGITVFFSRILIGYLVDRIFAPYVAMFFFSMSAIGLAIFAMGAVDMSAFFAAFLIGLSLGAEVDLLAYLTGRYFGLKSFGSAYGLLFGAILTGTAVGPLVFGLGYEMSGSYVGILTICVGINIAAVFLTAMLGRFPDWDKVEEVGNTATS